MIIVTGANGFIGSAFVSHLNEQGKSDIFCIDLVDQEARPLPLKKRQYQKFFRHDQLWDVLNRDDVKKSLQWVIHLGASSSTTETNQQYLWDVNTGYTQRLFQWCAESKVNLIYASSAATYGNGSLGYDDTSDSEQLKPLNLYGQSKVDVDRWVAKQSLTPPHWYGLRFFNVYGPNEFHKADQASVVFKAFHQIMSQGELSLFKSYNDQYRDGEQMRDFVYVKDICYWMQELMEKTPPSGVYNMGFGKARSWLDLANATFKAMNIPQKIRWIEMPQQIREHYQYFTEAQMQKWLKAGMSQPRWSLEDGVKDYVRFMQSDAKYL